MSKQLGKSDEPTINKKMKTMRQDFEFASVWFIGVFQIKSRVINITGIVVHRGRAIGHYQKKCMHKENVKKINKKLHANTYEPKKKIPVIYPKQKMHSKFT